MQSFKNRKTAESVVGGLSEPSKMPCWGYSIPAQECKIGQKLRNVKGTVCSLCYALKGRYSFNVVQKALYRRFNKLNHPRWVDAMVYLMKGHSYFRWHDAGDLQSVKHLERIARVAQHSPFTLHWLPTREYAFVKEFLRTNKKPPNLIIRLSAMKVDGPSPDALAKSLGVLVSGVSKEDGFNCPAPNQDNKCMSCRACWDRNIFNITYKKH